MARRRRAVEQASLRQVVADRVVVVLLAVVGASGLMSLLPGSGQAAVSRFACQVGSLGLSTCAPTSLALGTGHLDKPRCALLAGLDEALPEVRVSRLVGNNGLPVEIDSARAGTTYVRIGDADAAEPPFTLAGETRGAREVLPGASVPRHTAWVLPSAEGVDAIVDAVDEQHRSWVQRRSPLALVSAVFDRGGREIPPPTTLFSRLRLDSPSFPHVAADAPAPTQRSKNFVAIVPQQPAGYVYDRTSQRSSVVADLSGVVNASAVTGSVRWTRDASGRVAEVLIAIVSPGPLIPGDRNPSRVFTETAYLAVPVRTPAEQELVESWLSSPDGFTLRLDELLGLKTPKATDRLVSYLTRATTVTTLSYVGVTTSDATGRVRSELLDQRRTEWPDARLAAVSQIAPQSNNTPRAVTTDPSCLTP